MQDVFAYGKKQHELTQNLLAKQAAKDKVEAAKKGAPATSTQNGKPDGGK